MTWHNIIVYNSKDANINDSSKQLLFFTEVQKYNALLTS